MSIAPLERVGHVALTIYRYGLPTTVKGKPVPATPTTVVVKANIQPAGYEATMQLPEAYRTTKPLMVFSQTEIRIQKEGSWDADEFEWQGDRYTFMQMENYAMGVLNHWCGTAVRKQLVK